MSYTTDTALDCNYSTGPWTLEDGTGLAAVWRELEAIDPAIAPEVLEAERAAAAARAETLMDRVREVVCECAFQFVDGRAWDDLQRLASAVRAYLVVANPSAMAGEADFPALPGWTT